MKVILATWIVVVLFPVWVFSQVNVRNSVEIEDNYQDYRKTFESELGNGEENPSEAPQAKEIRYSAYPVWLQDQLTYNQNSITITGISDPGIDSLTARSQAICRALFLGSLMNGSQVRNLVDYYSQEKIAGKTELTGRYADYFEFNSVSPIGIAEANVIKEEYTGLGECIVLVEFPLVSGNEPALRFQSSGMITEFEKNGRYECNSRIDFSSIPGNGSPEENFKFIFRSVNGLVEVESYHQEMLLPLVDAKFKYTQAVSPVDPPDKEGVRTDKGLWNAMLLALIKDITVEIRTQSARVQTTADNYTGNTLALDRETVTGNLTFRLNRVIIHDINLWAIMEQFNFTQP